MMDNIAALLVVLLALALVTIACSRIPTPDLNAELTTAAKELAAMPFDSNAPVMTSGHVSTLVWPEEASGVIVVETGDGMKYAFSTAPVAALAKQGFTKATIHPGDEVGVSGILAPGKTVTNGALIAARADIIFKADGTRAFVR